MSARTGFEARQSTHLTVLLVMLFTTYSKDKYYIGARGNETLLTSI